jgi:threonine dehydrogenase-like Zn-dependent dehydrogenase
VLKVPPALKREAMFIEPLSIAEKGIQQIRAIQSRFPWACNHPSHSFRLKTWGSCKTVLVVGAGPLGLMATVLFRLAGTSTFVDDILPEDHPKAELVRSLGANYIDGRGMDAVKLIETCCGSVANLDMIFEASGAAETALQLMLHMSRSSIYVMTGIPRGDLEVKLDASELVRQLVRYNQVVVGSVNSNRSHFEMAARDMAGIHKRFPGMFETMVTRRVPLNDYQRAFVMDNPRHIKTIMEIDPWD